MTESEAIAYFCEHLPPHEVLLGSGDDAALLACPEGEVMVLSVDTMVEGTHFEPEMPVHWISYRALVAAISDLTAMGARGLGLLIALTRPALTKAWMDDFRQGCYAVSSAYGLPIVGGDITRGPLSLTVQVTGSVPAHEAMRQGCAQPHDEIWITGYVGGCSLGFGSLSTS